MPLDTSFTIKPSRWHKGKVTIETHTPESQYAVIASTKACYVPRDSGYVMTVEQAERFLAVYYRDSTDDKQTINRR